MLHRGLVIAATIGLLIALPKSPTAFGAESQAEPTAQKPVIAIPPSLETEHHEIHEALAEAMRAPGRVEEILYPAAMLVGDIIRARMAKK